MERTQNRRNQPWLLTSPTFLSPKMWPWPHSIPPTNLTPNPTPFRSRPTINRHGGGSGGGAPPLLKSSVPLAAEGSETPTLGKSHSSIYNYDLFYSYSSTFQFVTPSRVSTPSMSVSRDLEEDKKSPFDMGLLSFSRKYEGSLMKKLRETGEWVTDQSESKFRASGKLFLMFTFQWILPIWVLSFLVASGLIKLPFNTPFLDQLLM